MSDAWHVYLLRCGDGTFYCGIAKDVKKRFEMHVAGTGARYTRGRGPLALVWQSEAGMSHGDALRLERKIKGLPRGRKLALAGIS